MTGAAKTDRRGLIGGALLLPVVAATACQPEPLPAKGVGGLSPRFAELSAAYAAAKAAEDEFIQDIYDPASQAEERALDAIPEVQVQIWNMPGWRVHSTRRKSDIRSIRDLAEKDGWELTPNVGFIQNVQTFLAAADEREAEEAKVSAAIGMDAIEERFGELQTTRFNLENEIVDEPALVPADLLYKLRIHDALLADEAADPTFAAVTADVRRLLSGEVA